MVERAERKVLKLPQGYPSLQRATTLTLHFSEPQGKATGMWRGREGWGQVGLGWEGATGGPPSVAQSCVLGPLVDGEPYRTRADAILCTAVYMWCAGFGAPAGFGGRGWQTPDGGTAAWLSKALYSSAAVI